MQHFMLHRVRETKLKAIRYLHANVATAQLPWALAPCANELCSDQRSPDAMQHEVVHR
jgi:hypothetical protein